jgi:hypothetical protein
MADGETDDGSWCVPLPKAMKSPLTTAFICKTPGCGNDLTATVQRLPAPRGWRSGQGLTPIGIPILSS